MFFQELVNEAKERSKRSKEYVTTGSACFEVELIYARVTTGEKGLMTLQSTTVLIIFHYCTNIAACMFS